MYLSTLVLHPTRSHARRRQLLVSPRSRARRCPPSLSSAHWCLAPNSQPLRRTSPASYARRAAIGSALAVVTSRSRRGPALADVRPHFRSPIPLLGLTASRLFSVRHTGVPRPAPIRPRRASPASRSWRAAPGHALSAFLEAVAVAGWLAVDIAVMAVVLMNNCDVWYEV